MICDIIIPAYNEAPRVAVVIAACLEAKLGEVWVVDDGSSDTTSQVAQSTGAKVITLKANQGKAAAIFAGARASQAQVLLLVDADLLGLKAQHLIDLAKPVLEGGAEMSRGDFKGGRWQTHLSQNLAPILNGQRALLRERLLNLPELEQSRYGFEVKLAKAAREARWRIAYIPLKGVSQVMKEEKRQGFWQGIKQRMKMYQDIIKAFTQ
ncbi:MAG: glycosyltransferase [Deinococcales bacterium]